MTSRLLALACSVPQTLHGRSWIAGVPKEAKVKLFHSASVRNRSKSVVAQLASSQARREATGASNARWAASSLPSKISLAVRVAAYLPAPISALPRVVQSPHRHANARRATLLQAESWRSAASVVQIIIVREEHYVHTARQVQAPSAKLQQSLRRIALAMCGKGQPGTVRRHALAFLVSSFTEAAAEALANHARQA
jgi:hypothetical protein